MNRYQALITAYHAGKPKYLDTIGLSSAPFAALQSTLDDFINKFDLDRAVSSQLDALGLWIGIGRVVRSTINGIYFSFDTEGLGYNQGSWQGVFDDMGFTALDDEAYRTILRAKILANNWDGTMATLSNIYQGVFPDDQTQIFAVDNLDMTMSVYLTGSPLPAVVQSIIAFGYLDVKPGGVRIADYTMVSEPGPLFGFDADNKYLSGFDKGMWGLDLKEITNG
ncbi:DUF2612 domain-containing protein [Serratia oryzae]|uniref:Bacteriophage protein n=1 Tax=Serratia oryzae TaxID=2034155 RepID=A0A1S8CIH7_9GAMM|nr:DUF2612 domain-containing protein [Serratia oryzae]OMQ22260.1 hypothetical protein BMI79_12150 [Serratia oryzae]VXD07974.1 conserved hypothetical protein [Enterobacterales bacterium 8AC]